MPGPKNKNGIKRQQKEKEKAKAKSKKAILANSLCQPKQNVAPHESLIHINIIENREDVTYPALTQLQDEATDTKVPAGRLEQEKEDLPVPTCLMADENIQASPTRPTLACNSELQASPTSLTLMWNTEPFITDPGNGPRVRDMTAYLKSFFCPPISYNLRECNAFGREEVLGLLEAVLPREVALILWYNKTRQSARVCPCCQRIYQLGDVLLDHLTNEPLDVRSSCTPPQVHAEQELSGICSQPCFMAAAYSSYPYVAEVVRGTWGRELEALDAHTRSLLDSTDPRSAALLRYGFDAWDTGGDGTDKGDQGLGRVLRLSRLPDLGLGDALKALAWHDNNRRTTTAPTTGASVHLGENLDLINSVGSGSQNVQSQNQMPHPHPPYIVA